MDKLKTNRLNMNDVLNIADQHPETKFNQELQPFSKKREDLLLLSIKYKGDYFLIKRNLFLNKIPPLTDDFEKIIKVIGERYVTIFDKEYPIYLKQIEQPPWVLYYIGDINLLNNFFVFAVVGKRNNPPLPLENLEPIMLFLI